MPFYLLGTINLLFMSRMLLAESTPLPQTAEPATSGPENVLIYGFSEVAPYKYTEAGEHKGIDVMLIKEVAAKLGLEIRYYDCPFKRCLELMKSGNIDIMTAVGYRDERKQFVEFLEPPYSVNNAKTFYLKKGSPVQINTYEDIAKYKIGVKTGVAYFPRFDHDEHLNKEPVHDILLNLRKLSQDRIDAAINSEIEMDYLIIRNGMEDQFQKSVFRDESGKSYVAMSKKSKLLGRKAEFEGELKRLVANGRAAAIVKQFLDAIREQAKASDKNKKANAAKVKL